MAIPTLDNRSESKPWLIQASAKVFAWGNSLDVLIPNHGIQSYADKLGRKIEDLCVDFFQSLNDRLDAFDKSASLPKQVVEFAAKFPLKVIRSNILSLYRVVKTVLYTANHPMQAVLKALRFALVFTCHMMKFENWPKMGAALVGASLAQTLFLEISWTHPVVAIGLVIGAAMVITGVFVEIADTWTQRDELEEKCSLVFYTLFQKGEQVAESFASGLLMGSLLGYLQTVVFGDFLADGASFDISSTVSMLEEPSEEEIEKIVNSQKSYDYAALFGIGHSETVPVSQEDSALLFL